MDFGLCKKKILLQIAIGWSYILLEIEIICFLFLMNVLRFGLLGIPMLSLFYALRPPHKRDRRAGFATAFKTGTLVFFHTAQQNWSA